MSGSAFHTVAPVSAVCAAFAAQPSAYPLGAEKAHVAPPCGSKKNSTEAQRSGFGRKRRHREMDETCRLRRGEGYGARVDEAGETAGAFSHQPSHFCPQCGRC